MCPTCRLHEEGCAGRTRAQQLQQEYTRQRAEAADLRSKAAVADQRARWLEAEGFKRDAARADSDAKL